MALLNIYRAASWFLSLISTAILIYCLLTWIAPRSPACSWLARFIAPFCQPFRRLSLYCRARWGSPFDLTCLFALIAIRIIQSLLGILFSLLINLL